MHNRGSWSALKQSTITLLQQAVSDNERSVRIFLVCFVCGQVGFCEQPSEVRFVQQQTDVELQVCTLLFGCFLVEGVGRDSFPKVGHLV